MLRVSETFFQYATRFKQKSKKINNINAQIHAQILTWWILGVVTFIIKINLMM